MQRRPWLTFAHTWKRRYVDEFDTFLVEYQKSGSRDFRDSTLRHRLDPEELEVWERTVVKTGARRERRT